MPIVALPLIPILSLLLAAGPPEEAVGRMQLGAGFRVELVAAEPLVRQPVAIDFDDRGRLWAIQYLQYPNPAGLKRVAVDRYSRTKYDRVPEPPPRGPRGADRITILEDTDGDGRVDRAKDFVSGLNLATGFAFGHGGVFVLNVPYLLFYPDRDHDDVPDADPDVLLTGFGMDDAHSVANSLTWGPDGWLYGCQGSTVTANIRGIEFQQGVWRYHPLTHEFELFCEGGGNSWGLDFDRHGQLVYSTNFGGHVMLHGVQGAYYWKSFGKHGALHNPYAYGYFDHVPHANFRGGHVTVGGLVYRGDLFPASFRDKYITGDLLGHGVYWHHVEPAGSTFRSAHGGEFIVSRDTWFAPCDVTQGPDGAVYVSDWHDARTAHPDPDAEWDRSNGRVFRIVPVGQASSPDRFGDLRLLRSTDLVALLSHRNSWIVTRARKFLAERRDPEVIFPLRTLVQESPDEQLQLESLWALYVSGGFDEAFGAKLLDHRNAHVRRWAVRLLGDEFHDSPSPRNGERGPGGEGRASPDSELKRSSATLAPHPRPLSPFGGEGSFAQRLLELAANEPDIHVRSQLASTAKRLPGRVGLPIVHRLLSRNADATDGHLPLLCWWAVERHAVTDLDLCLELFATPDHWKSFFIRNAILHNLTQRLAAEGTSATLRGCARMLAAAPSEKERLRLVLSIEQGTRDSSRHAADSNLGSLFTNQAEVRSRDSNTNPNRQRGTDADETPSLTLRVSVPELDRQLANLWSDTATDLPLIRLLVRFGRESAWRRVRSLLADRSAGVPLRTAIIQIVGEAGDSKTADDLLGLLVETEPDDVRIAALDALRGKDRDGIAARLVEIYPAASDRLRQKLRDVLLSRRGWAGRLVAEVESKRIAAKDVSVEQLRLVALHNDAELDERVRKLWGSIKPGTPEEKLAEMRRLSNDLRAGSGDAVRGRELFRKQCATCHQFFGEGEKIGPDLTHANRADRDYLLASMVDPSAVVRAEFMSYVVTTPDGRVFTGLIAQQSPTEVTLLGAKNERTIIRRDQIDELRESPTSLMPEDQLKQLKPQELRDLFAYLQTTGSLK